VGQERVLVVNITPGGKRLAGRKVAAVLAGGLVFGVGALATLASWNDSEAAKATFDAGVFRLQGSLDGVRYTDHSSLPGGKLAFSSPFADLHPGSVVYAPFALQLTSDTTSDATVVISATSVDTVSGLSYQLVRASSFGCDAATTGTSLVTSSVVGAITGAAAFELTRTGATNTAYLCFKVTADGTLKQGQTGTGIWQFDAVSKVAPDPSPTSRKTP
jgi:predicted ribosomally synthesized peptide with SipW-like signal peptide